MSDRPIIAPNLTNTSFNGLSMASSFFTPATVIQRLPGISYDISWTGTPTGTFSIQVSNTFQLSSTGAILSAGNWNTLPAAAFVGTLPAPAGSSGNGFIDVVGTEAYAVRLAYTATSGTGTCNVVVAAKVL